MHTARRGGSSPLVWLLVLPACAYSAGSLRDVGGSWPGVRATQGCVDIAVARGDRDDASGPVVRYAIGNRCESRVDVDLATAHVVARDPSGRDIELAPVDPRGELRRL